MANRPIFIISSEKPFFKEVLIDFKFFNGFAITQKQKSIMSLHESFLKKYNKYNILEVSSKSNNDLGIKLSAFNLMVELKKSKKRYPVEVIFQASKVFENGGPYESFLKKAPKEVKKDERLRKSGNLKYFYCFKKKFELEPKHYFYNWLYINALSQEINKNIANAVLEYDSFSDIEFNPQKSFNCQARALAIYVSLKRCNLLNKALKSKEDFRDVVYGKEYKEHEFEQVHISEKLKGND